MPSTVSFGDVIPLLQKAAASPSGIRFRVATYGIAVNVRQRCYRYRAKLAREAASRYDFGTPEFVGPYDDLSIRLETPEGLHLLRKDDWPGGQVDVVIHHLIPVGEILDGDGRPLQAASPLDE